MTTTTIHADSARDEIRVVSRGVEYRWTGGPYIDIAPVEGGAALDVINVWDYERDTPRIPFTADAMLAEIREREAAEEAR